MKTNNNKDECLQIVPSNKLNLSNYFKIPEPTMSLLFVTDESPSKIKDASSLSIKITIGIENNILKSDKEENIYAEPSLIWTKLPIKQNYEIETKPIYYPSYARLSPEHRFQYLNWLRDITQETNLSYVFLYYYGLERHLLVGNYDLAVNEVIKLIRNHDRGTFKSYAISSLTAASLYRKRFDILDKVPLIIEEISNASLLLKGLARKPLGPEDVIKLAYTVKFYNKRYIKLYPDLFKKILQTMINIYEKQNGYIFDKLNLSKLPREEETYFANLSVPKKARFIKTPQILENKRFQKIIYELLSKTHLEIKEKKQKNKKLKQKST